MPNFTQLFHWNGNPQVAVLRDRNCRPDAWLTFRSRSGQSLIEWELGTGVEILRPASSHNPDRVVVSPVGRPGFIASVSLKSLKPFRP